MTAYEIAFGVVLIIVSVLIVVFTLSQTQKGQGLSAAIMGDSSFMAARPRAWPGCQAGQSDQNLRRCFLCSYAAGWCAECPLVIE